MISVLSKRILFLMFLKAGKCNMKFPADSVACWGHYLVHKWPSAVSTFRRDERVSVSVSLVRAWISFVGALPSCTHHAPRPLEFNKRILNRAHCSHKRSWWRIVTCMVMWTVSSTKLFSGEKQFNGTTTYTVKINISGKGFVEHLTSYWLEENIHNITISEEFKWEYVKNFLNTFHL